MLCVVAVPLQLQFDDLITDARFEEILRIHGFAVDCDDVIQSFHLRAFEVLVLSVEHLQLAVVDLEHASGDGCCRRWKVEDMRGNLRTLRFECHCFETLTSLMPRLCCFAVIRDAVHKRYAAACVFLLRLPFSLSTVSFLRLAKRLLFFV